MIKKISILARTNNIEVIVDETSILALFLDIYLYNISFNNKYNISHM